VGYTDPFGESKEVRDFSKREISGSVRSGPGDCAGLTGWKGQGGMVERMDIMLPEGLAAAVTDLRCGRETAGLMVRAGARCHPLVALSASGFTIAADGRPPLRGSVEILDRGRTIACWLVQCAWAGNGLVAYRNKRGGSGPTEAVSRFRRPDAPGDGAP
jgi:hypothetical protein